MGFARAIATNTAWLMGGKFLVVILSLVMTAALARSLGVFHYGELTVAFAYISMFAVIADFGFFQILVREIARHPNEEAEITNNLFTLRTLFGLVVYGLAALSVWLIPGSVYGADVKIGVGILAAASFFLSINTTLIGVFQAHQEMKKAVVGDVVSRTVLLGILIWALSLPAPLSTIFSLYVIANLLNLLITSTYLRRELTLRPAFDFRRWKSLFVEAWPLGVVTMLGVIYFKLNLVILSVLRDPTDVGIYGASYKLFEFLTIVPGLFMGTVFPVITQLIDLDKERLRRVIQAAYDALLIFVLGAATGLIILAQGAIDLLAGHEFVTASTTSLFGHPLTSIDALIILSLALLPVYLGNLWGPVVIAFGRQSALIRPGLWAVALNIGLNLLLIPRGSYVAAALVTLLTEGYIAWSWSRIARHSLATPLHQGRAFRTLLAALMMAVVIWPIRHLNIVIPTFVGGSVYLLLIWMLGVIPKDILAILKLKGSKQ
jgi:O-antigen/teichoic acid export membrane protein